MASKTSTNAFGERMATEEPYSCRLVRLAVANGIIRFGDFTLKSGRSSPYFYNAGLYNTGLMLNAVGLSYAAKIIELRDTLHFDVLFGPAYKGIPLAAITAVELHRLDPSTYNSVGVAYNRKEPKCHGEGGSVVGASLSGKRVLIIDDVITAGTAIRESIETIRRNGGHLVGVIVSLDRQEKSSDQSDRSAIQVVEQEFGIKVHSVIQLMDIIKFMKSSRGFEQELEKMQAYRKTWGISMIQP